MKTFIALLSLTLYSQECQIFLYPDPNSIDFYLSNGKPFVRTVNIDESQTILYMDGHYYKINILEHLDSCPCQN